MRNKDLKIAAIPSYFPPSEWKRFKAIEAHTAGEPGQTPVCAAKF